MTLTWSTVPANGICKYWHVERKLHITNVRTEVGSLDLLACNLSIMIGALAPSAPML